jgi:hypothetical protein
LVPMRHLPASGLLCDGLFHSRLVQRGIVEPAAFERTCQGTMKDYTILNAIADLGGINPVRIKKAGTWTEWSELPRQVRTRIFRNASSQSPDEIAAQLPEFGVEDERSLLEYLRDPSKCRLSSIQARDYDALVVELESMKRELDSYRGVYKTKFVKQGNRWIAVHIPITDVPF